MGLMLDTCVFIRAEKTGSQFNFDNIPADDAVCMSVITVSELLMGVARAESPARKMKRSAFVEAIINTIPIIDFTPKIARIHAEIYAILASQGQLIGSHDLMIAASAIAHGHTLMTTNEKEFKRVPGLVLFKAMNK